MKSRLRIKVNIDYPMMCTNDNYLLYCPEGYLSLLNDQGHQISKIKRNFNVMDICWSSYLNQFLVLEDGGKLYSMDVNDGATKQLKQIKTFDIRMKSVTCYEETFIVSSADHGSFIEEYNLSDWKLVRKHKPPYTCQANQMIWQMKLNSSGSRLGIILQNKDNRCHTFELRNRNDMKMVHVVEIGNNLSYSLLSLPDQQFFINTLIEKKHFLIDPNGYVKETITYVDAALIISTVLMNRKSLIIQTMQPNELRFYDL